MDVRQQQLGCAPRRGREGVALIIVLLALTLATVLVVGVLLSASVEMQTASGFAAEGRTRILTDSVINRVESQIQVATRGADANNQPQAWASQPGMIRTFDATGKLVSVYRLYSGSQSISVGSGFSVAGELPPNNWDTTPELYTDLNSPLQNGSQSIYPIVCPSAAGSVTGFSFNVGGMDTTSTDALPMPTRWLYVLQDGTMTPGTSLGGNQVRVTGASSTNPIMGRVAFWTDDDTCKVNINTASGTDWTTTTTLSTSDPGTFWDMARADTTYERNLATHQPLANEFQRYPGHPATTSLSAVFPSLTSAQIFAIVPRIVGGGSTGGTVSFPSPMNESPLENDQDRLYANVDEMYYTPARQASALSATQIENTRFFLTAHSVSPDLNIFNLPRVSMWPEWDSSNSAKRSTFDNLSAFASTIGGLPFYFQRNNPYSMTTDLPAASSSSNLGRNRTLMEYLRTLFNKQLPGFGGSLAGKYSGTDAGGTLGGHEIDQILTEIFDYIRCTNTQGATGPDIGIANPNAYSDNGLILPIKDTTTNTEGFGRYLTVNEVGFVFYGMADYLNGGPTTIDGKSTGIPPYPPGLNTNNNVRPPSSSFNSVGTAVPVNSTLWVPYNSGTAVNNVRVRAVLLVGLTMPSENNPLLAHTTVAAGGPADDYEYAVTGLSKLTWSAGGSAGGSQPMYSSNTSDLVQDNYMAATMPGRIGELGRASQNSATLGSSYAIDLSRQGTFSFSGGTLQITITDRRTGITVQTLNVSLPAGTFPVPGLAPKITTTSGSTTTTEDWRDFFNRYSTTDSTILCGQDVVRTVAVRSPQADQAPYVNDPNYDFRLVAPRSTVNLTDNLFGPSPNYSSPSISLAASLVSEADSVVLNGMEFGCYAPGVSQMGGASYTYRYPDSGGGSTTAPVAITIPSDGTTTAPGQVATPSASASMAYANLTPGSTVVDPNDKQTYTLQSTGSLVNNTVEFSVHQIPSTRKAYLNNSTVLGDWDNGMGGYMDGPFINNPDEGSVYDGNANGHTGLPYFYEQVNSGYPSDGIAAPYTNPAAATATSGWYIPNAMVPSSMMLGSLPTGVEEKLPWQTILFRPGPSGHPGLGSPAGAPPYTTPPDHLFADFFNMPIVQPYPMTTPLATDGQINMNYQIMPFSYITRSTGVQAVLASEQMLAIPNNQGLYYKIPGKSNRQANYRTLINLTETLKGFQQRFTNSDIFHSASEICSLWLVPTGQSFQSGFPTGFDAWRGSYQLTGDNSLERPYADIYPRLTTRSNTYTIHYKVQTLKVVPSTADPTVWNENTGIILGEFRGSTTLERYLDPNDSWLAPNDIASEVTNGTSVVLGDHYRFRVLGNRKFSPVQQNQGN